MKLRKCVGLGDGFIWINISCSNNDRQKTVFSPSYSLFEINHTHRSKLNFYIDIFIAAKIWRRQEIKK